MQRSFRFGVVNEMILPTDAWLDHVRRVEELRFDTFLIRDHFLPDFFGDQLAPLPALMAAASATNKLRIGTLVLDNDYRHPVMLAKEAATVDYLSGGRLELGMGAGWLRNEYEAAGMTFERAGIRIDRLVEAIRIIKGLFGDVSLNFSGDYYQVNGIDSMPKPVQRPHPPILIGGGKQRMLRLAGREANVVSLLTSSVASGTLKDDPTERLASSVEQKIGWIRDGAGDRFPEIELNLIPTILFSEDRDETAQELIDERDWDVTVDDVLEMPSLFIGTQDDIGEQMYERRNRYGISYYVISDTNLEQFAPIVAQLSGH